MSFMPVMGPTKSAEYDRSAEFFSQLCKERSPYFGLAMLLDSGYERKDMLEVLKRLNPKG